MLGCFRGYSSLPGQGRQNDGTVRNLVTMSLQRGRNRDRSTVSGLTPFIFIQIGILLDPWTITPTFTVGHVSSGNPLWVPSDMSKPSL